VLVLLILLSTPAQAGGGPWTLNPGEHNVYVGLDYFRYRSFRGEGGVLDELDTGLTAAGVTGVWTIGMANDVEVELKLPFESVRANDRSVLGCSEARPDDWCEPTAQIGDLGASLKWRVVDELYDSPVSVSISGGFRSGEAYANHRGRLTTLGDGQTDLGAGVAVGKTGRAGRGWYTSSAEAWYFYRFANTRLDGRKVPADEVAFSAEGLWAFHPRVAAGPALFGFTRLGGVGLDDIDYMSPDGWSALMATQVKVGGKVAIFSTDGGPTVVLSGLMTVFARNNPSDTLALGFGVGWFFPRKIKVPD
jgi:hypothetical protein